MDEELIPFLRQYRHNNSDEFVAGFDLDGVKELVARLRAQACARDEILPMMGMIEVDPPRTSDQSSRTAILELSIASLSKENERLWRVIDALSKR